VVSTVGDPLPLPVGLVSSLEDQLDLVAIEPRLPTLEVFENRAWLPTAALLEGPAAEASTSAGPEVLVRTDLREASAVFVGADQFGTAVDDLSPGVVHLGVPFDDNWSVTVDGSSTVARRAFGETTAFDVAQAGVGELRYDSPVGRLLLVLLQVALWVVALVVVSRLRVPVSRRTTALLDDETLISLSVEPAPAGPAPAPDPDPDPDPDPRPDPAPAPTSDAVDR